MAELQIVIPTGARSAEWRDLRCRRLVKIPPFRYASVGMTDKNGYAYFLTNWTDEVLYIGVTSDLVRRLYEHRNKLMPGFTARYNLSKLVYVEHPPDIGAAIAREKQLKKWRRDKKDALVDAVNPDWRDISPDFS